MIRSTFGGFTTALSALQANQKRLDITSQNLANMNNVGYTRQQLETTSLGYKNPTSYYMNSGDISAGFGVGMKCVSQIRDPYLDIQYRSQMGKSSYNSALQDSFDSLSSILDETNISGIRQAFDDIQSSLTSMQSPDKVEDPIYEAELRSRMDALCDLLNDAAREIEAAEKLEFTKLSGEGSSEQGAVEKVNDLLKQIGDLNVSIKRNQVMGQSSLELIDERNVLIDELSSYIPIEVSYAKDASYVNDKEYPDDLYINMVYTDKNGDTQKLTLINGTTKNNDGKNYGSVYIEDGNIDDPLDTVLSFTSAEEGVDEVTIGSQGNAANATLSNGSIQASLDMLGSKDNTNVNGYDFYMSKLDTLANQFASIINSNNLTSGTKQPDGSVVGAEYGLLLVNKKDPSDDTSDPSDDTIKASNIGINSEWIKGSVRISTYGDSKNDAILGMLADMKNAHKDLDNKSFSDYMNNVSAIFANDSSKNSTALKNNVTVLNSIQDSRDSMSGVSMDEEAANMMTYLSAYNAASRIMTAMDEALETLINNTGRVGR